MTVIIFCQLLFPTFPLHCHSKINRKLHIVFSIDSNITKIPLLMSYTTRKKTDSLRVVSNILLPATLFISEHSCPH